MKHLPIGGSTAGRTKICAGWVREAKKVPTQKSGLPADDGNLKHDVMEDFYNGEIELVLEQLRGRTYGAAVWDDDMLEDAIIPAYTMTEEVLNHYMIEEYLCEPFVEIIPDLAGGSIDLLGISKDKKTVLVLDYKFGRGVVSVENNPQLLFYAQAAWSDPKTKDLFAEAHTIALAIIQPMVSRVAKIYEVTIEELAEFAVEMDAAIALAQSDNAPIVPSRYCQFCPVAPYCKERKDSLLEKAIISKDNTEKLRESLEMLDQFKAFIASVEETAHELMSSGVSIDGWKLVDKRATRKWADPKAVDRQLGIYSDLLYEQKMVSPAAFEKAAKKNKLSIDINELVVAESSGTTIAPADDKRPNVVTSPTDKVAKRIAEVAASR